MVRKMKIWDDIGKIDCQHKTAIALGAFDGLHIGHRRVIDAVLQKNTAVPAVFTFTENPHGGRQLLLPQEKEKLLADWGMQKLFRIPFEEVRTMEPAFFLEEVLLKKCRAAVLSCGEDFRFGSQAKGNAAMMKDFCDANGIQLTILPDVDEAGERVSSTRIRTALENGEIRHANAMLGRRFGFTLPVIQGNRIGRTLGTPTINQALPQGFIEPKYAIYASFAKVEGMWYQAVTNIGVKPTVGSDKVLAETWILDFTGDLYGKQVRIELADYIRPEVKFASLEELKTAIFEDADKARRILAAEKQQ